jgi:hypothetical protein
MHSADNNFLSFLIPIIGYPQSQCFSNHSQADSTILNKFMKKKYTNMKYVDYRSTEKKMERNIDTLDLFEFELENRCA